MLELGLFPKQGFGVKNNKYNWYYAKGCKNLQWFYCNRNMWAVYETHFCPEQILNSNMYPLLKKINKLTKFL